MFDYTALNTPVIARASKKLDHNLYGKLQQKEIVFFFMFVILFVHYQMAYHMNCLAEGHKAHATQACYSYA